MTHLKINDRFNWAYPQSIRKLLTNHHGSIFLTDFSVFKGYLSSPHKFVFNLNSNNIGAHLYDIHDFSNRVYFGYGYERYRILVENLEFSTGFAAGISSNEIGTLLFLLTKDYGHIIFEIYNGILKNI
jgi:hypothetical protein